MPFIPFSKKKNPRKVHGFLCDGGLWYTQWILTRELQVPHYCTIEHELQLGGAAIANVLSDAEAKTNLVDHLTQEHLIKPLLDPENAYDRQFLAQAHQLELKRQEFEKVTRELIKLCDREDINPWFLLAIARKMVEDLRQRRRSRDNIPRRHSDF